MVVFYDNIFFNLFHEDYSKSVNAKLNSNCLKISKMLLKLIIQALNKLPSFKKETKITKERKPKTFLLFERNFNIEITRNRQCLQAPTCAALVSITTQHRNKIKHISSRVLATLVRPVVDKANKVKNSSSNLLSSVLILSQVLSQLTTKH